MTAIIGFFIDKKRRLVVTCDRLVTDVGAERVYEADKFFTIGDFYIFYAGAEDVFEATKRALGKKNFSDIEGIANEIKELHKETINDRVSVGKYGYEGDCEFILINPSTLEALLIRRAVITDLDFSVIGTAEIDKQKIKDGITELAPNGSSIENLLWNAEIILKKMVNIYDDLSRNRPCIGHPSIFGMDIFVFELKKPMTNIRLRCNQDLSKLEFYSLGDGGCEE